MSQFPEARHPPQRGFALAVSLIFLVALTLIAIVAIRTTGLGARMAANNALSNEALETSEAARTLVDNLVEGNAFYSGWPCGAVGGCSGTPAIYAVDDRLWTLPFPAGMTILRQGQNLCTDPVDTSKPFKMWFDSNDEAGFNPVWYRDNSAGLTDDACYSRNVAGSGIAGYTATAAISVYKLRTDAATGAGQAFAQGYDNVGGGAAGGGGYAFFFVQSEGVDPSNLAQSQTGSVYRYLIR